MFIFKRAVSGAVFGVVVPAQACVPEDYNENADYCPSSDSGDNYHKYCLEMLNNCGDAFCNSQWAFRCMAMRHSLWGCEVSGNAEGSYSLGSFAPPETCEEVAGGENAEGADENGAGENVEDTDENGAGEGAEGADENVAGQGEGAEDTDGNVAGQGENVEGADGNGTPSKNEKKPTVPLGSFTFPVEKREVQLLRRRMRNAWPATRAENVVEDAWKFWGRFLHLKQTHHTSTVQRLLRRVTEEQVRAMLALREEVSGKLKRYGYNHISKEDIESLREQLVMRLRECKSKRQIAKSKKVTKTKSKKVTTDVDNSGVDQVQDAVDQCGLICRSEKCVFFPGFSEGNAQIICSLPARECIFHCAEDIIDQALITKFGEDYFGRSMDDPLMHHSCLEAEIRLRMSGPESVDENQIQYLSHWEDQRDTFCH